MIGAIWASYAFDLAADGVATLGKVPSGLPSFGIPSYGWNEWTTLLATAGSIFLVVLAQSAATSRAYAAKYADRFNENVDLVGLSMANVSAGLSGTFVVNGSPTKTQMVDGAGGRSQLSQLTTAVIVLIVLLFLTVPLQYMPETVLSTIVFLIGIELVDVKGMRKILSWRFDEFVVAAATALVVVVVGVEQGILLAIVLSVLDHLRRSYHPRDTVLTRTDKGKLHGVEVTDEPNPPTSSRGSSSTGSGPTFTTRTRTASPRRSAGSSDGRQERPHGFASRPRGSTTSTSVGARRSWTCSVSCRSRAPSWCSPTWTRTCGPSSIGTASPQRSATTPISTRSGTRSRRSRPPAVPPGSRRIIPRG